VKWAITQNRHDTRIHIYDQVPKGVQTN
jgi:hypothetical protein